MLALLQPNIIENDKLKDERENAYVRSYLDKVKEEIGNYKRYEEFLEILYKFPQSNKTVVELYKDVCEVLGHGSELCNEFVGFLLPGQALECGKIMEFFTINKMKIFLRKLEVHFNKHPQNLHKIIKIMSQFQKHPELTIDDLKDSLLPMLRGQSHLLDEFLHLFPQEQVPESLMTDFEEIVLPDVDDDHLSDDDDGVENIDLPDEDDMYGGLNCGCQCHISSSKPKIQNRLRHCIRCGIKFVGGKVFLQAGKVLRPCQFVYNHGDNEPETNLSDVPATISSITDTLETHIGSPLMTYKEFPCSSPYSPLQSSSVSSLSPAGSDDDNYVKAHSSEKDENLEKNKKCDSIPSSEVHASENPTNESTIQSSVTVTEETSLPSDNSTVVDSNVSIIQQEETTKELDSDKNMIISTSSSTDSPDDSVNCNDPNANVNNPESLIISTVNEKSEANDKCLEINLNEDLRKESSRADSCSISAKNHSLDEKGEVVVLWTREWDRIILQSCQQYGPKEETFALIAKQLKKKTPTEVQERFTELLSLFSVQEENNEMTDDSEEFDCDDKH